MKRSSSRDRESPVKERQGRNDVGYKRPPKEHQFKPGQKPPPRKKRKQPVEGEMPSDILWKLLHEQRRIASGGKVTWISGAELIFRRAFTLAEEGNATMGRLVVELVLAGEKAPEEAPERFVFDPDGPNQYLQVIRHIGPTD